MPISKTNDIYLLVKSLTPAEKRHFKSYSQRNQNVEYLKFLSLFDVIDRQKVSNDSEIFEQLNGVSKSQYANLKRHLFKQILSSLKIINKSKRANVQIREYIDYAYTLYEKGLYMQALKILAIAKREANKFHYNHMHLTIIEMEKQIEMRHITRSGPERVGKLIGESNTINRQVSNANYLSNLRIELHGMYILNGHTRDKQQQAKLKIYFDEKLSCLDIPSLGVLESIYCYQSYVWYHFIRMDFKLCRKYADKWIEIFRIHPEMAERDINLLMRAYHYHLTSSFHLKDYKNFEIAHKQFENLRKEKYKSLNANSKITSFLYVHSSRLDKIILSGKFEEGAKVIPATLKRIKKYKDKLDNHRILVFYFKIAWVYFGNRQIDKSISFLNRIVNQEIPFLRMDIQIYARLLFLMCHYELNNFETINYLVNGYSKMFKKVKETSSLQLLTYNFFKKIENKPYLEHNKIFNETFNSLKKLKANPFQRNSLSYLDVLSWVQSKLERQTIAIIIKRKTKKLKTIS